MIFGRLHVVPRAAQRLLDCDALTTEHDLAS